MSGSSAAVVLNALRLRGPVRSREREA
jgi:hypothetical protein